MIGGNNVAANDRSKLRAPNCKVGVCCRQNGTCRSRRKPTFRLCNSVQTARCTEIAHQTALRTGPFTFHFCRIKKLMCRLISACPCTPALIHNLMWLTGRQTTNECFIPLQIFLSELLQAHMRQQSTCLQPYTNYHDDNNNDVV